MSITFNIYYKGKDENPKKFVEEMIKSGIVNEIRAKKGNLRYDYFIPLNDEATILLIDSWENQEALDNHHNSETMKKIIELRNKYDLHMIVEKYIQDDTNMENNIKFIRKWFLGTLINTILEKYNFDGKKVIPFCTSGGSGIGRSGSNLAQLAKSGSFVNGERLNSSADTNNIQSFINNNK